MIGDHNDLQVISTRPNGVLVTENRGKGIRFTRVRIVVGSGKDGVVYKTADFHRPWTIGMTPNAAIQAKIDQLNAALAPILNVQIGTATKAIPRTDQCGNTAGRLCESLVGNVVTDAMRDDVQLDRRAVRDHELGRPPRHADLPDDRSRRRLLPAFSPPPHPITRGQSIAAAPVREPRGDDRR